MRKFAAAIVSGAVTMILGGCGVTSPVDTTTASVTAIDSITAGQSEQIQGSIQADSTLTLSFNILNSVWDTVNNGTVYCTFTSVADKSTINLHTDADLTIVTTFTAASGIYYLQINASTGTSTYFTEMVIFKVVEGGAQTTLNEQTLMLGAQQSSFPSLLDADSMTAYSDTITNPAVEANIDAIFSYSTAVDSTEFILTSPSVASASPYSGWTIKAASQFKDVTATVDFASITNQSQIDNLWGNGAGVTTIALHQGQSIVILTNTGAYKLIMISGINGTGGTATMNIDGKY